MTRYYKVRAEVAGNWAENSDFVKIPGQPTRINRLHYAFQGWDGDCLLTAVPVYIGTEALARAVKAAGLTGVHFDEVEVSKQYPFEELYPGHDLPKFSWFKIDGTPEKDDFGLGEMLRLVVSQRALDLLKDHGLNNADVEVTTA